jgi:hypothetical protein
MDSVLEVLGILFLVALSALVGVGTGFLALLAAAILGFDNALYASGATAGWFGHAFFVWVLNK